MSTAAEPFLRGLPSPFAAARNSRAIAPSFKSERSWIAPEAKKQDLLYVSADDSDKDGGSHVYVYSYPGARLEGTLTGFTLPAGECVDKAGDVFITNNYGADVLEYAHGGIEPIATLSDPNAYPTDCSIDPTTGNLAVANYVGPGSAGGSIAIYTRAQGAAENYSDQQLFSYFGCQYDDAGNLFIDADNNSLKITLVELPKSSTSFTNITLPKLRKIYGLAVIEWDGKYVTIGNVDDDIVYRLRIFGSEAKVVGSTPLTDGDHIDYFTIPRLGSGGMKAPQGETLVGPDYDGNNVKFWSYPAGGTSIETISGIGRPVGTAVSEGTR